MAKKRHILAGFEGGVGKSDRMDKGDLTQRREGREGGGERSLYGQRGGGEFDGLPVPVCGQRINKIVKMKEKGMPLAKTRRREEKMGKRGGMAFMVLIP